jgi:hypothetical protein
MYRVIFHHIDRFLKAYESSFEREYGYLRPIVQEVVDKYLDCGNPKCGFARIRCSDLGKEKLLMFSCKTRSFCPSCHAKRREKDVLGDVAIIDGSGSIRVNGVEKNVIIKRDGSGRVNISNVKGRVVK